MSTRWERCDVELGLDRRFDRDLEVLTPQATDAHAAARMNASGKPFLGVSFARRWFDH